MNDFGVIVIGIAGGTGSGKTTLANKIKEHFGDEVAMLYHDNYYKKQDGMPFEERCRLNYDHPDAFDTEMLIRNVKKLKSGESIESPLYDYLSRDRSEKTVKINPGRVILIEGILVFENKALRDLMDIKIFVDTDADVRVIRRILRDMKSRGRSLESVTSQYLASVKPMHEAFVEPSKKFADIIVPEGGENEIAYQMIIKTVEEHLNRVRDL